VTSRRLLEVEAVVCVAAGAGDAVTTEPAGVLVGSVAAFAAVSVLVVTAVTAAPEEAVGVEAGEVGAPVGEPEAVGVTSFAVTPSEVEGARCELGVAVSLAARFLDSPCSLGMTELCGVPVLSGAAGRAELVDAVAAANSGLSAFLSDDFTAGPKISRPWPNAGTSVRRAMVDASSASATPAAARIAPMISRIRMRSVSI